MDIAQTEHTCIQEKVDLVDQTIKQKAEEENNNFGFTNGFTKYLINLL